MYIQYIRSFTVCIALVLGMFVMPTAAENAVAVHSTAGSAILYEPCSGRVLYEKNAHVKRPMASTTKLMTALLAAERLPLERSVKVSDEAVNVIGTRMGLQSGDEVSCDALIKGLLLSSGNDAANALALAMASSYEAFAKLMNERAKSLGMHNTQFVTPSGLDADGHGSTAYDMAILAQAVLENRYLAAVCLEKQTTVTVGDRKLTLTNHNKLLSKYPDAIGLKTGYTSLAGRCLVSAAKRDGVTLIAVTLHCRNDWEEHMALFEEGFSLMTSVTLKPSFPQSIPVYGGETASVGLQASTVTQTVPSYDREHITVRVQLPSYVWATVEKGQEIGCAEYRLHGDVLATVPIYATQRVCESLPLERHRKMVLIFLRMLREATVGLD